MREGRRSKERREKKPEMKGERKTNETKPSKRNNNQGRRITRTKKNGNNINKEKTGLKKRRWREKERVGEVKINEKSRKTKLKG